MNKYKSAEEYRVDCARNLNRMLGICDDHPNIKWVSGNGISVSVRNMERSHIVNIIRKIAPKARLQNEFSYIHEFNEQYYGRKYSEWLEILTNEYKLRAAHEEYEMAARSQEWESFKNLTDDIPF